MSSSYQSDKFSPNIIEDFNTRPGARASADKYIRKNQMKVQYSCNKFSPKQTRILQQEIARMKKNKSVVNG